MCPIAPVRLRLRGRMYLRSWLLLVCECAWIQFVWLRTCSCYLWCLGMLASRAQLPLRAQRLRARLCVCVRCAIHVCVGGLACQDALLGCRPHAPSHARPRRSPDWLALSTARSEVIMGAARGPLGSHIRALLSKCACRSTHVDYRTWLGYPTTSTCVCHRQSFITSNRPTFTLCSHFGPSDVFAQTYYRYPSLAARGNISSRILCWISSLRRYQHRNGEGAWVCSTSQDSWCGRAQEIWKLAADV